MIVYGALAPHPPLIIPEIGGRELQQVTGTVKGMNSLAAAPRCAARRARRWR